MKFTKDHEWVSLDGDIATVGISACSNSNDDAKTPGNTEVATGGERFGTADAETAKLGTDAAPGDAAGRRCA